MCVRIRPITEEEKLSLEEIGQLDSLCKAVNAMGIIKQFNLHETNPILNAFFESYKRSDLIHGQIEMKLNKYSNYKSGDLIFQDYDKLLRFRQLKGGLYEKLETFVLGIPLHHVAVCCKGPNNTDQMSHVLNEYERESFLLRDKATMSGYRLDPTPLLNNDPDFIEKLNKMYQKEGKDASTEIKAMYQDIQNSIHSKSDDRFQVLLNDAARMKASGIAELFKGLHTKKEKKGQFAALHQEIAGGKEIKDKKVICSEFAAKTLITGLLEQEEQIFQKMLNYLTKEEGMSTSEARNYLSKQQIFKLPIKENEKLSKLNPTRFLTLLAEHGSLTWVAPSPLLRGLIKAKDLERSPGEEIIEVETISGYKPDEIRLEKMKPKTYQPVIDDSLEARKLPDNPTIADKWLNMDPEVFENQLKILIKKTGGLYPLIRERREEINALKEEWRSKIALMPRSKFRESVLKLLDFSHSKNFLTYKSFATTL